MESYVTAIISWITLFFVNNLQSPEDTYEAIRFG